MAFRVNDLAIEHTDPYRTYFSPPVILKYIGLNFEITVRRSNQVAIFHQNKPRYI